MMAWRGVAALVALLARPTAGNKTATWLAHRDALIGSVYGQGDGVLPTKAQPDQVLTYPGEPGLQGLVWNMSTLFEITSTVFYSPITPGKTSKDAFLFHHGHSDCVCPWKHGQPAIMASQCRPGCNSSMPSGRETTMPGYSWWDLYNVS